MKHNIEILDVQTLLAKSFPPADSMMGATCSIKQVPS